MTSNETENDSSVYGHPGAHFAPKYSILWQDWLQQHGSPFFPQPQTEDIKNRQHWYDLLTQLQAQKQEERKQAET